MEPIKITRHNVHHFASMVYAKEVKAICKDFFEKMSINYFSLTRVYPDGSYSDLFSNAEWIENYIKKEYFTASLEELIIASSIKSNFIIWQMSPIFRISDITKNIYEDCQIYNYTHGITLIQRFEGYTENYHFCSAINNGGAEDFLLRNIDQLEKFCFYIKEEIFRNKALKLAFKTRYFFEPDSGSSSSKEVTPRTKNEVELDFNVSKFYLDDSHYLTVREMDVLRFLFRNRSGKEIAHLLNISPRTVETHIEKIKLKTNCNTMRDLTSYVLDNKMLFSQLFLD